MCVILLYIVDTRNDFIEILSRTNLAANPGIIKMYARQKFSYRAQGCQERLPDEFHSRGIWVNRIRASAATARPFHFHL